MPLERLEGCWTALITPFTEKGALDLEGLRQNVNFQIEGGAKVIPTGTTGESPTVDWKEHNQIIEEVVKLAKGRTYVMAGTGSNSTQEALRGTKHAVEVGAEAVLLMDCYYNGPSSLELRTEYYEVVAKEFPKTFITPYVIPARTGTQLEVEDLVILHRKYKNVRAIKDATGDLERMAKTRRLLGDDFDILSGDDDMTVAMMTREDIKAQGVVSVISNICPAALAEMTAALGQGDRAKGKKLAEALDPLFKIVTVKIMEEYEGFQVPCKFRNPSAIKTLMRGLGMPAGPCRPPLGRMTPKATAIVRAAIRTVYEKNRELLIPLQDFYHIDLEERISRDEHWL
ncbi:MAG: 4-hydroxy-tetrahydrodipicolinate synthase [Deltaproteobacteria bacterium RBG_16_54_11]|jgi:4-hydroxy-tetrahydrodipicolinate synthase|nr:MAG: 4-hydroxy-tetrahydrodipicolinate synthase [Deltaproteobacteria bacterium RBG_16_54_11]